LSHITQRPHQPPCLKRNIVALFNSQRFGPLSER
jgi:hypothetical protein